MLHISALCNFDLFLKCWKMPEMLLMSFGGECVGVMFMFPVFFKLGQQEQDCQVLDTHLFVGANSESSNGGPHLLNTAKAWPASSQAFLCRRGIRTMSYVPREWRRICHTTLLPLQWVVHETVLVISIPRSRGKIPALNTRLFTPTEAQQPPSLYLRYLLSLLYIPQLILWSQHPFHPTSAHLISMGNWGRNFFLPWLDARVRKTTQTDNSSPNHLRFVQGIHYWEKKIMSMTHIIRHTSNGASALLQRQASEPQNSCFPVLFQDIEYLENRKCICFIHEEKSSQLVWAVVIWPKNHEFQASTPASI